MLAVVLAAAPAADEVATLRAYEYYAQRTAERALPSIPLLPASHRHNKKGAALATTATSIVPATITYDPVLYKGTACEDWCHGDVHLNVAAAKAAGRVSFPADGIADWNERCSWDQYCAGCSECGNASVVTGGYARHQRGQCAEMCPVLADPNRTSFVWNTSSGQLATIKKAKTYEWSTLCGWGICWGCAECYPTDAERKAALCAQRLATVESSCMWFIEAWIASDGVPNFCSASCFAAMGAFADCAVEQHFDNFTSMMHQCERLNSPSTPPPPSPPSPPSPPPLPPHTPCDTPWNQRERLEPPPGTGWRGSTLGTDKLELGGTFTDTQDPEEYEHKYGYPLHILRVFRGRGNAKLNDAQIDWVKNKGGIIFYSVYKTYNDWANVGDPRFDWAIDAYVQQFKAVAPAKMWICLRFEPGLYTNSASVNSTKYKGTVHDYKKMWHYIMDYFAAAGVTNAVWVMDYSTEANHDYIHPQLAALWPGDEDHKIDWLLWNVFTYSDGRGVPFKEYVGHGYRLFESLSGVPQEYCDYEETYTKLVCQNYTVNWTDTLWGIGAWGANAVRDWQMIDEGDRKQFLLDAADAFGSANFSRLRAHVYFDSYGTPADDASSSEVGNTTFRRAAPYSDSPAVGQESNAPLYEAYQTLLGTGYFTANDDPLHICSPPSPPPPPSPPSSPPPPPRGLAASLRRSLEGKLAGWHAEPVSR